MHSKHVVPKIILHNLFIIAAYAISLFVCLFVPMKLFFIFFVPFNFIFQIIFLFLFDAVVYTILNRMPFVCGLHYFLFILIPTLTLLIVGIILVYFNVKIESIPNSDITQLDETINMKLFIIMLILPYITVFAGYCRHMVSCKNCGKSGICLMVRKEHYKSNYVDNTYKSTSYGKIGEVQVKYTGEHVADVYGNYETTEGSIDEVRNYTTNFRCKCCGNFFDKNWTCEQVGILRKIKDKISGSNNE